MIPVFGIAGQAGSGKDTLAAHLAEKFRGVCVAQADPMKRLVMSYFSFTEEQLWGPSEARNFIDSSVSVDAAEERAQTSGAVLDAFREVFGQEQKAIQACKLFHWNLVPICRKFEQEKGGLSARIVLQTLGTEVGRAVDEDAWSRYAIQTCMRLLSGGYKYHKALGLVPTEGFVGYESAYVTDVRFRNEVLGLRTAGAPVFEVRREDPEASARTSAAGAGADHRSESELKSIPSHFYSGVVRNESTIEALKVRGEFLVRNFLTSMSVGS